MQTVQMALSNGSYAARLRKALARNGAWDVVEVENPDPGHPGVIVLDERAFDKLVQPIPRPERIVLVTRNEPRALARAWDAGIISVVFDSDSPETTVLSILAAQLRVVPPSPGRPTEPAAASRSGEPTTH